MAARLCPASLLPVCVEGCPNPLASAHHQVDAGFAFRCGSQSALHRSLCKSTQCASEISMHVTSSDNPYLSCLVIFNPPSLSFFRIRIPIPTTTLDLISSVPRLVSHPASSFQPQLISYRVSRVRIVAYLPYCLRFPSPVTIVEAADKGEPPVFHKQY